LIYNKPGKEVIACMMAKRQDRHAQPQDDVFTTPPEAAKYLTGAQVGPVGVFRASRLVEQELVLPWYYFFCPQPGCDGEWIIDGKAFEMPSRYPPSVAVKVPHLPSRARRPGPCPPLFNILVTTSYFESLVDEIFETRRMDLSTRLRPMRDGLEMDLSRFHDESQRDTLESQKLLDCLTPLVVVELLRSVVPENDRAPLLRHLHPGVNASLRLIRRDFRDPLSVKDMALAAGLSPSQFMVVFKRDMGCTPHEYLNGMRIEEARRLLSAGSFITETAFAVGFDSLSGFEECFIRLVGVTPSAYRRVQRA
jgi:AraC-like DNA-binding protein